MAYLGRERRFSQDSLQNTKRKSQKGSRFNVLGQVTSPLGFYVLALLIVEGTLSIVLTTSKLDQDKVWTGFLWMIGLFIGLVTIVTVFAALAPKNLLFGKEEHSDPLLEPSALKDQIEDLIYANVKNECLKTSKDK